MAEKTPKTPSTRPRMAAALQASWQTAEIFSEILRRVDPCNQQEPVEPSVIVALASRGKALSGAIMAAIDDPAVSTADLERTVHHG